MTHPVVNSLATYGLFAAWALHDAEELATGPRWIREHLPVLRKRFPDAPESLWSLMESVDEREFAVAVGAMATIVGAAAAAAAVAGHRSGFYQGALGGFGLHGLVHLGQAAAFRATPPAPPLRRCSWCPSPCGRGGGCGVRACCGPPGRAMC